MSISRSLRDHCLLDGGRRSGCQNSQLWFDPRGFPFSLNGHSNTYYSSGMSGSAFRGRRPSPPTRKMSLAKLDSKTIYMLASKRRPPRMDGRFAQRADDTRKLPTRAKRFLDYLRILGSHYLETLVRYLSYPLFDPTQLLRSETTSSSETKGADGSTGPFCNESEQKSVLVLPDGFLGDGMSLVDLFFFPSP